MTLINLTHPIGPISSVTVRVPDERDWDNPPPGVSEAIWNLARSTGLTVNQALSLAEVDVDAIGAAFEAAIGNWNVAQRALRAGLTS